MTHQKTFWALHEWTDAMFEKLGWMLLAKRDGYDEKIKAYLQSIDDLLEALNYKIEKMGDHDKKKDLKILRDDVEVLRVHARRDFGTMKITNNIRNSI